MALSISSRKLSLEQKSELEELEKQLQQLNKQHKEIHKKSKRVSRQIGEAKRKNEPIDDFKSAMRSFSVRLNDLDKQRVEIEQRILHIAGPLQEDKIAEARPSTTQPEQTAARHNKSSVDNSCEITIGLMGNEHDEWNAYVTKHPAHTIHHRSEWQSILQSAYSLQSYYFTAREPGGRIVGVLPMVRHTSLLFGDFLVSMPWFARAGAIADHPLIEQKLMQAANEMATTLGSSHIEYRDDLPREELPVQTHKVNMVLPLPETKEELWRNFTPKLRAQIKRPQYANPQVSVGRLRYLDDFYRVYTRNMRDLGSPQHSKVFIKHILERFPDNSWLVVLQLDGRAVSAGLLLGMDDTLEIPLASTIRDVNPLSMNMLLYWEILKFAIDHGYKHFDFGRSSIGAGTYRFKRQWGAQPKQLYWHYWLRNNAEPPSINPSNPRYALVISIWKRLPIWLARWLGAILIKYLP